MDRRLQGEREREMEWSRMGFLERVETILSRIEQIELTVVLARLPMCRFVTTTASVVTSFCSLASPPPAPAPSADANLKRRANRDDDEMYNHLCGFFFFLQWESRCMRTSPSSQPSWHMRLLRLGNFWLQ